MADDNARELLRLSDQAFSRKGQLDTLWQTLADEVHPARATFTKTRIEGDEYADELYTSVPAQNQMALAYALGALTRPKNQNWFDPKAQEEWRNTERAKAWFARQRDKQRTLLYTRRSNFQTALQTSDSDVVTFGNAVIRHHEARDRSGLMVYHVEHLVNCAWFENDAREVDELHRKFKLSLRNWAQAFPGKPLPERYKATFEKTPDHEIELRHIVMPADRYGYDSYGRPPGGRSGKGQRSHPYRSVYIDPNGQEILREGGYWEFIYTVRRWFLADNSPYAYSPAAMLGLVEARLLQAQERVILEAGERAVDPPAVAYKDAVLGAINNYAGATTWIDGSYDERTGAPVQFVDSKAKIPIGLEMKQDTRNILAACWFLNKLNLPDDKDMTAFEVNERISEYIRSVGPAMEPFETHNAQLLDTSFSFNLRIGHFTQGLPVVNPDGSPGPGLRLIPPELRGADVVYEFDGPIQLAAKRQKLMKAKETRQYAAESMEIRPDAADNFNFDRIDRDAADLIGGDPDWLVPKEEVAALRAQRAQQAQQAAALQQAAQMGAAVQGGADTVQKLAAANQAIPLLADNSGAQGEDSMLALPPPDEGAASATGIGAGQGGANTGNASAAANAFGLRAAA